MPRGFNNINLERLKKMFPKDSLMSLGNDIFVASLESDRVKGEILNDPSRFDGYLCLYCVQGEMNLNIDLNDIPLKRRSFAICMPGSLINLKKTTNYKGKVWLIVIAVSTNVISKLRLDLKNIFRSGVTPITKPVIRFNKQELKLAEQYFNLITEIVSFQRAFMHQSINSLAVSMIYELAGAWAARLPEQKEMERKMTRSSALLDRYIHLINEYHTSERSVQFYADKLCVSTKHLTRQVKEFSGRTASEWIDTFVIMEAKSLLIHTDKTIKEVAASLNFCNQTVFYRYFKKHTGMLPTEYREQGK